MNISWQKSKINVKGETIEAVAPLIISASRSTDIPAFHSEWFMERLKAGYLKWINPFNRQPQYVSFEKVRVVVFWTKNAKPIIKYLPEIDNKGVNYYFTFTINDYETEGLEPHIPSLKERIKTFKELSEKIGKEKVIWRFDPLVLTDNLGIKELVKKIEKVGAEIHSFTEKLVISFADISTYNRVKNNLTKRRIKFRNFDENNMRDIASELQRLNKKWGLEIATCAEKVDLSAYGIKHNKCVDDQLMLKLFKKDPILMNFLGYEDTLYGNELGQNLKDKGQRKECGCIISKDIGQYNTCKHLCVYCYANHSEQLVKTNFEKKSKSPFGESITGE